jgi:hypothetical protein
MNLENEIFSIQSETDFESVALEVYRFQATHCTIYKEFIHKLGHKQAQSIEEIPFLPISFFKSHDVISDSTTDAQLIFLSSGTTGMQRSKHLIHNAALYERSFIHTYKRFIGNPSDQVILALLPNYVEQGNSSLVYMVDHLIRLTNTSLSGFMLTRLDLVEKHYQKAIQSGKKVVIFGVSYALLDLAEKGINLSDAIVIETGGMKGRRKEMIKEELHELLIAGLGVPFVRSEYGMTELLSQAYSDSNGVFTTPNWLKILCRDTNDPFQYVEHGKTGGINVIDLANLYSCSFIATQDLGKVEGNSFRLMGRFDNADIRGCNMLVD